MNDTLEASLMDAFRKYPKACDEVWFMAGNTENEVDNVSIEKLKKAADDVRSMGIVASLQEISLGHPDGAACPRGLNASGFRAAVGMDGTATLHQTCPRDTLFAEKFAKKYAQLCQAIQPDNVMIDDDLRLTMHDPAGVICFCDDCIKEFNRQYGHDFQRESLSEKLNENEGDIRKEWIAFSQEGLTLFARTVAREVHKLSPNSHIGLQHAAFHQMLMEGWDWNKIFDAIRQETGLPASSRPGHGEYNDHSPRGLINKAYGISRQIARLKGDFHMIFPEIEGYDHRATGKSPQGVCTETMLHLSMGANSMSYALICNNHEPMQWYADNYFKYLDRYHDLFSAYVSHSENTVGAGIDDYMSPSVVYANDPDWMITSSGSTCCELAPLGIPFTPEGRCCTASIVDAENVAKATLEELESLVTKKGIVLDNAGWKALQRRGLDTLLTPIEAEPALPSQARCFVVKGQHISAHSGAMRIAVLPDNFHYSLTGAQRYSLLKVFDWASAGKMAVFPETFSQCVIVPKVSSQSGKLRCVTYLNATITDQENITLRLRNCPEGARLSWEDVNGSHKLKVVWEGSDVLVTIPFIKAWDAGWIKVKI